MCVPSGGHTHAGRSLSLSLSLAHKHTPIRSCHTNACSCSLSSATDGLTHSQHSHTLTHTKTVPINCLVLDAPARGRTHHGRATRYSRRTAAVHRPPTALVSCASAPANGTSQPEHFRARTNRAWRANNEVQNTHLPNPRLSPRGSNPRASGGGPRASYTPIIPRAAIGGGGGALRVGGGGSTAPARKRPPRLSSRSRPSPRSFRALSRLRSRVRSSLRSGDLRSSLRSGDLRRSAMITRIRHHVDLRSPHIKMLG